jgi:endoglucanase
MKKILKLILVFAFFYGEVSCNKKEDGNTQTNSQTNTSFIHTLGNKIVDSKNNPIQLKGIAFGNEVWSDKEIPDTHHSEIDFERVKSMNMNLIRFYINYKTFEDDAQPYTYKKTGLDWLNKNIAWAKKYGIYLIVNLHVPQGGFQSLGTGDALWTNPENQKRVISLWKHIAETYKNESQIIGFGLVNEPVPTSSLQQWQTLAQSITDAIRTVDKNHIIFIEKPIYVKGITAENENYNFPTINDSNKVYEFHIYDPIQYTHQLFDWASQGDGGKYPDENSISFINGSWYTATFNNPKCEAGNSDWTFYEGEKYKITDPLIKIGAATLVGANVTGKVYFDDIFIKEYDQNNIFVRDIMVSELDDKNGWSYWSNNNTGGYGIANIGHSNDKSLYIESATDDCNIGNNSSYFIPKQNYYYQINGWMKGENIANTASCKLRIDFTKTNDPIFKRNKQLLESNLKKYTDWSKSKGVPVYMGEFGVGFPCFQNNKGGLEWVADMVSIAKANDLTFTYHTYHEDSFGLYFGYGTTIDPLKANQPLIDFFKSKL